MNIVHHESAYSIMKRCADILEKLGVVSLAAGFFQGQVHGLLVGSGFLVGCILFALKLQKQPAGRPME